MSTSIKKGFKSLAWLAYLVIVFEIIYMISPFALYYYSTYGPSLNFLHNWPQTAWLSQFFLPHFSESSSWLLNALPRLGWIFLGMGSILFLIGAGQIYWAKFTKGGAVTGGLYQWVRNPQYTAFAIMGLGVLLIWPRFLVFNMYVTMLFVYNWLARYEEKECEEKFGESFKAYVKSTPKFIPVRIPVLRQFFSWPQSGAKRLVANLLLFGMVMTLFLGAAFGVRNYALNTISISYSKDSATIATALMSQAEMARAWQTALGHPEVQSRLAEAGYGTGAKLLNYIVPLSWFLPDLPLERAREGVEGHYQPKSFNREEYKVLFTKARLSAPDSVAGVDIIKKTVARMPIIVVKLNLTTGKILGIETPPPHVRWGDIPTPLF